MLLPRISELIERETGDYYKSDPDPFDDRHPGSRPLLLAVFTLTPHLMFSRFQHFRFQTKENGCERIYEVELEARWRPADVLLTIATADLCVLCSFCGYFTAASLTLAYTSDCGNGNE